MASKPCDAVIVGGGIVGANCAVQLSRAGVDDVVVLEADGPASKASGRAAGNLTTYRHERFGPDASRFGRELYEEYEDKYDDLTLHRDQSYSIAYSEEGAEHLRSEYKTTTFETEFLDAAALTNREPAFATEGVTGALRFENAVFTDPEQLTLAAHAVAKDEGVIVDVTKAEGFETEDEQITVETTDDTYKAPVVVVAAGAWSKKLLKLAGTDAALQPRTSQIAILDTPNEIDLPMWAAPDFSIYGRSTPDGRVLFGGGTETLIRDLEGFKNRAQMPFLDQLAEHAPNIVPALEGATLYDDWAGRVTATPDRYPYIGETEVDGMYLCAGFNGEGISNSPFGARLLADLVVDREPIVDPTEFDPMRFNGDEEFEISNAVEWWADR